MPFSANVRQPRNLIRSFYVLYVELFGTGRSQQIHPRKQPAQMPSGRYDCMQKAYNYEQAPAPAVSVVIAVGWISENH